MQPIREEPARDPASLQGVLHVVILEETLGDGKYEQHLGFDSFLEEVQWMRSEGLLRPGGRVFAHHFSHSGNPSHAELEAFFRPHGVEAAYDGLKIDL
jgi:phosphoribosyl 1,2-cyclic phosphate phosphodiesterase